MKDDNFTDFARAMLYSGSRAVGPGQPCYNGRFSDPANQALSPGYIREAVAWLRGFLA